MGGKGSKGCSVLPEDSSARLPNRNRNERGRTGNCIYGHNRTSESRHSHIPKHRKKRPKIESFVPVVKIESFMRCHEHLRDTLLVPVYLARTRTLLFFVLIFYDSILGRFSLASVEICLYDRVSGKLGSRNGRLRGSLWWQSTYGNSFGLYNIVLC